ncbi:zinc finger CCCH domain-containing protein 17-like [Carex rostrata]
MDSEAGRCNRHRCSFLHSQLPDAQDPSTSSTSKRVPRQYHNLVWQNPRTGDNNEGNQSKCGKDPRGENTDPSQCDKPCKYFLSRTCSYGERCRYLHSWSIGDTFSLITPLKGHKKVISAIALPSGSDKLYSGSKDGTVKVWDCQTGQCVATVNMGREVGCMISVEPWLFVGIPDSIKVWNTQTGAEMSLSGPTGQVYALVAANDMLFAGTHDGRILVWRYSAPTNCFEPAASLLGHSLAVISLVVGGTELYSGSMDKAIKVWDLTTFRCVQTLADHTNVVMSLLYWDQFLFSCSLDNTVKIWCTSTKEHLKVIYTHVEEHGVIALCGMQDLKGKPVLMCSLNDNSVHLYDLPSFNKRGTMFAKQEVRTMQMGPGGIFFTGDGIGELKVWKWSM